MSLMHLTDEELAMAQADNEANALFIESAGAAGFGRTGHP
jgi:hypothetical protein